MRTKTKKVWVAVLAFVFCVMMCFALLPAYAAEDTDTFVILTDTSVNEQGEPVGSNSVALTDADGGVTVAGKQQDSRTVVVYDHGYPLGSKVTTNFTINADYSGLNGGDLKSQVYFSLFFAQADKSSGSFNAADFKNSRTEGNGVALHLFTSADLATDNRSMVNISTFGKRDIVNTDSMYGNTHGDGITDIGWAYATNKPVTVEIGTEKVNGVDHIYVSITVDRTAERPAVSNSKISIPLTDMVQDPSNQSPYYIGFEFANMNATERSVNASIAAVTAEEAGLVVEPDSVFLKPGQTEQLTAKDASTAEAVQNLTYTVEDETVASVSDTGLVTALKAGVTKILVTAQDGRKGETYVTVANNITLDVSQKEMTVGEFSNLKATTNPLGLGVVWETSNAEVVTVDGGVLEAKGVGTVTITAKVQNFESGDLELKATCEITVKAYEKPQDVHEEGTHYLYSDNVIVGGNGFEKTEKGVSLNATVQNGAAYTVIGEDIDFEKAVTFDFINKYDADNTTYANQFNRYLSIAMVSGNADELTAADFTMGAASGLQVNLSTNNEWLGFGLKFMLPYQTGVGGTVESLQTPENKGELTGTDKFGNAFARAFCDGTRIQVKMWKDGDKFYMSFTPVFTEGEVPDGSENMTYPGGSVYDYVGPYTISFDWSAVSAGAQGNWNIAIGVGNTIAADSAKADLAVENINVGKLYGVEIDRTTHQMKAGTSFRLTGKTNPNSYVAESAVWESSDTSVATVDNEGNVTAVKSGKTTITYKVDGMSAACEVTVVGGLTVSEKSKTLKVGETFQISATVDPADVKPTFASGDDRIATVDENGKVTAVKEGEVKIYVRVGSLFSEEIMVTVTAEQGGGTTDDTPQEGGCSGSVSVTGMAACALALAAFAGVMFLRKKKV